MDKKVVECFFIVDKATPLKPVPSQPMGSQRAPTTAADLLSRQWEGKITYMNPTLSEDDLSPSTWIVKHTRTRTSASFHLFISYPINAIHKNTFYSILSQSIYTPFLHLLVLFARRTVVLSQRKHSQAHDLYIHANKSRRDYATCDVPCDLRGVPHRYRSYLLTQMLLHPVQPSHRGFHQEVAPNIQQGAPHNERRKPRNSHQRAS